MILVTGATGNAGGGVVNGLLERGADVRGLVRQGSDDLPDGVVAAPGDLNDPDSLHGPLEGVSAVFLLSGYEGLERTLELMRDAGVERVVLLSSSAAPTENLDNAVARYHILSERAVHDSGLPWTFLRPNSFMANALRWRDQLERGDVVRAQFPEVAVATIDPRDIAEVAVRAFTEDGHTDQAYRLTGPVALTPPEQVEILGRALGRPLRCHGMSRAETHDELHASMPAPYAAAFESFFADGTVDETSVTGTVETVTGHPPRTFEQWTIDNAALFTRAAE